jgi:hypothetical protein
LRSDDGATCAIFDHPDRTLARLAGGGFEIEAAGEQTTRAEPAGEGWRIEGPEAVQGWLLRRNDGEAPGFLLSGADGRTEAGRTMPLVGTGREAGLSFLLLDDGRLFRIVGGARLQGGFELLGWEMAGAYLAARPAGDRWTIAPTAAGAGIADLTVISILFAAEILESERTLRTGKT